MLHPLGALALVALLQAAPAPAAAPAPRAAPASQAAPSRPLAVEDYYRLKSVGQPHGIRGHWNVVHRMIHELDWWETWLKQTPAGTAGGREDR